MLDKAIACVVRQPVERLTAKKQRPADNQCDFGKWLYGAELTAADKPSLQYRTVRQWHAEFHKEAGRLVDLATMGQKDAAERAIGMDSKYTETHPPWRKHLSNGATVWASMKSQIPLVVLSV